MDVGAHRLLAAHTRAAHVALICQDQRRRNRADRRRRLLIVMPDGGDNLCGLVRRKAQTRQNIEGEARAVLRVVMAVDEISDIVHIACDLRELTGTRIVI